MASVTHHPITGAVADWLDRFARCVRDGDMAAGREMFACEVVGFGSWTVAAVGLETLVRDQWSQVWPRTRGFRFDLDGGTVFEQPGPEGAGLFVVAVPWSSQGVRENGPAFERRGRATIVLRRSHPERALLAHHTHFSLNPPGTLDGSVTSKKT